MELFDRAEKYVYDSARKFDPGTGVPLDDIVLVFDDTGSLTNRFLHGPAIDQVFASEDALGEVLWGLSDHQGTVRDVVDYDSATNTTTIANHRQFDAFGNLTNESNPNVDFLYSYTGRIYDEDVGLYYYRARWYDPLTGRFVSEDPIGFAAGDINVTRYAGNSVTNWSDPSGLQGTGMGRAYEAMESSRRARLANLKKALKARLEEARDKHSKYTYYKHAGVNDFFDELSTVLGKQVVKIFENDFRTRLVGAECSYDTTNNTISLARTVKEVSELSLIHEMIHALDDYKDWYIGGIPIFGGGSLEEIEALAYAGEHIFGGVYLLQQFETKLKEGKLKTPAQVNQAWHAAWGPLNSLNNQAVWVRGKNLRNLNSGDIKDAGEKLGLDFSYSDLVKEYQKLANKHMTFKVTLTKPDSLKPCFE